MDAILVGKLVFALNLGPRCSMTTIRASVPGTKLDDHLQTFTFLDFLFLHLHPHNPFPTPPTT